MKTDFIDSTIIAKGIQSVIGFYKTISSEHCDFNDATAMAFYTGINSPFLNPLFDLRNNKNNSHKLLEMVESFYANKKAPWAWFVFPSIGVNDLLEHGYTILEEAPSMYFNLQTNVQLKDMNNLSIKEEKRECNLENWFICIKEGFGVVDNDDSYCRLNAQLLNQGDKRLRHFTAYLNDEPAAAGTLYLGDDSVMIHNLATRNEFRNQGIGTYLTTHMMLEAKNLGFEHCYLDASEEAFNLYKRLGFSVYATTKIYSKV